MLFLKIQCILLLYKSNSLLFMQTHLWYLVSIRKTFWYLVCTMVENDYAIREWINF